MLSVLPGVRVWVSTQAVDMRLSHNGLSSLVQTQWKKDTLSGNLFVFFNRGGTRVKILYWDRNGFCLWYKRLEKGRFHPPQIAGDVYALGGQELGLLLEGIELTHAQRLRAC